MAKSGGSFKPGQSGNPSGRPKKLHDVVTLAQTYTPLAMSTLAEIMRSKKSATASRVAASVALLERGWGKPVQPTEISGPNKGPVQTQDVTDDRKPLTDMLITAREAAKDEGETRH